MYTRRSSFTSLSSTCRFRSKTVLRLSRFLLMVATESRRLFMSERLLPLNGAAVACSESFKVSGLYRYGTMFTRFGLVYMCAGVFSFYERWQVGLSGGFRETDKNTQTSYLVLLYGSHQLIVGDSAQTRYVLLHHSKVYISKPVV